MLVIDPTRHPDVLAAQDLFNLCPIYRYVYADQAWWLIRYHGYIDTPSAEMEPDLISPVQRLQYKTDDGRMLNYEPGFLSLQVAHRQFEWDRDPQGAMIRQMRKDAAEHELGERALMDYIIYEGTQYVEHLKRKALKTGEDSPLPSRGNRARKHLKQQRLENERMLRAGNEREGAKIRRLYDRFQ